MAKQAKAGWQDKYDVVGIVPGIIVTKNGEIDLSNATIPLQTIEQLEAEGCLFIKKKTTDQN